ncbi:MAG: hypothetical protein AW10_02246 [Candidatus Accumulibacter appositus]|uniref:Uncharacterized protein n=1 Tax=Candidatus Accumulibacter appositus TaxID=1454003 RepID=A0A011NWN0_9PROT|nr:MAG: hypothetical protein AW10_02246 [Candidatus Accumulibacter appositus]
MSARLVDGVAGFAYCQHCPFGVEYFPCVERLRKLPTYD